MTEEPIIPAPPGKVSDLANPEDVLHTVNLVTQVLSIIVVTILVVLRVVIKVRLRNRLQIEDYMTILGWVLFVAFCSTMLLLNAYGGGYHAWDVPKSQFVGFQKGSYAVTIIYVPMVFAIKLALLGVIRRIFSPDRAKVLVIDVSAVLLLLYYIPALFIKIFFCKPISAYWNGTDDGGSCMNQRQVIIADAAISIASDFWILILPVPMLWSLRMNRMRKIRVMGVLGAGGLATGFSVWRLVMMVEESITEDTTWFWIHCVLTGNAEAGIGLICVCLPALSAYFVNAKNKSNSGVTGSYQRQLSNQHELNSWNKLPGSKNRTNRDGIYGTDQACLVSTVETSALELRGGGSTTSTLQESANNVADNDAAPIVIRKDVEVSQSYEYIK